METVLTSTQLWQDFNPESEALDVNLLKTCDDGNYVTKTVYFTGRVVSDGKTRVLGRICKKSGKTPRGAVLLVENYKAPIREKELEFWADNGFLAMAIDFAGRRTKGICTLYPYSLDYCNSDVVQSYFFVGENAKQTKVYEYALNCMRAVTYLLKEEKAKSVSLVAVKKGVAVASVVLGVDSRITNGALLFGSLYREYPPFGSKLKVFEMDGEDLQRRVDYEEKQQMWLAGIAPQSYAIHAKMPLYIVASANSSFLDVTSVDKIFSRLNRQSRMLLLPEVMESLPDNYIPSLIKWCKGGTVEQQFEMEQTSCNGFDNFLKIKTTLPQSKISVWYSRCIDRAKNWVKAPLSKVDDGYIAELSVYSQNSDIVALAQCNDTVSYTLPVCEAKVINPQKISVMTRKIFVGDGDTSLLPLNGKEDAWHNVAKVERCKGYLNILGEKGKSMATFAVCDPGTRRNEIFTVSFDVCCSVAQPLKVCLVSDFGNENLVYSHITQLSGDGKWQRITVEGSSFHFEDDGHQMSEFEKIDMLCFNAESDFIINNIFLV